jgi:hypothetical protein
MKKAKKISVAIIIFLFTVVSVYLIVQQNSSKFPDSKMYIYSH